MPSLYVLPLNTYKHISGKIVNLEPAVYFWQMFQLQTSDQIHVTSAENQRVFACGEWGILVIYADDSRTNTQHHSWTLADPLTFHKALATISYCLQSLLSLYPFIFLLDFQHIFSTGWQLVDHFYSQTSVLAFSTVHLLIRRKYLI